MKDETVYFSIEANSEFHKSILMALFLQSGSFFIGIFSQNQIARVFGMGYRFWTAVYRQVGKKSNFSAESQSRSPF
jgi:hypothetical protein